MGSDDESPYPGKVQQGDIWAVFNDRNEPVLATSDFDNAIDWASRSTVRRQLEQMREANEIQSKKAGEKQNEGLVWYPPDELEEVPQPTPNPIKLAYQHPLLALMVGGFICIGLGFTMFLPGFFGEGLYLGVLNRDFLVFGGLILYIFGVMLVVISGVVIGGKLVWSIVQYYLDN